MTEQRHLKLLVLEGPPRQRGRAHGEALRREIRELVAVWEEQVQGEAGMGLPAYLDRFRRDTAFLPALERWTPDLLQEVEGIAEGANQPLEVCRCLQYLDEHWHHLERLTAGPAAPPAPGAPGGRGRPRCSAVGGGRPPRLGQNMDLPGFLDGFQTLLRLRDPGTGLELLVPSFAGLIGLHGLNNRGLAVCVNTLSQLRCSPNGLPVAFVVRSTLERASLEDAADHLRRVPHASGQNYLLGGPNGLLDLECSASGAVRQGEGAAHLCHTNHPLASADLRAEVAGWDADRARADREHALTFTRLERLQRGVGRAPLTVARVKTLLREVAHPLAGPADVITFSSAVFEPAARRAHVAPGPAGTPYHELALV